MVRSAASGRGRRNNGNRIGRFCGFVALEQPGLLRGEFSVYVRRDYRGRGAGRAVLAALIEAAGAAGFHKLTSRVFPENAASRALLKELGFEEIGIHRRHGQLDGVWRECVIVERLLDPGAGE
jgi:L-amino acid N-acyltransferase YncA